MLVCRSRTVSRYARYFASLVLITGGLTTLSPAAPPRLPLVTPSEVGMRASQLERIDDVVQEGLDAGRMPGCVIAVGRHGKIALLRAYGNRQLEPSPEPMTVDTVFDMASITKPVATATSVMILVDQGQLRLRNPVSDYFPDFGVNGKDQITLTQLLTHHGGLIPDNAIADYDEGPDVAWDRILQLNTFVEPGTKFVYTDVGFIVLGELVRQASGINVDDFSQVNIFEPLGMHETGYLPAPPLRQRAAPTEQRNDEWMQGEVHDPRAYRLGGIAGHAGLFSTAQDLAVYAQMMLQGGTYGGVRVLSPRAVDVMTSSYEVSGNLRGLGWDKLSVYSSNRGETFSSRAFGHGGFTGTVLWIDPELDLFFIFLSNRVHPDGKGNVNSLAGRIATIVAGAIDPSLATTPTDRGSDAATGQPNASVTTGLETLEQQEFSLLHGQRIGLITNHTGINRQGMSAVDLLRESKNVNLTALFSPEHGFAGKLDVAKIEDSVDQESGLTIFSLYGSNRRPTAEQLAQVDTLVFDIQDIGTRFYTFVSTMGLAMQAAAEHGKRFVVLDRPNPINGIEVDGPVLDAGEESFVGFHTLPVRHGMTVGELARMLVDEMKLNLELEVVPLKGWQRQMYFDATGLPWVNPSPNMRNLNQALLYPGVGLLETTNLSVGRGTDTPFEVLGAPWIEALDFAEQLNRDRLPGVTFVPYKFVPESSKFAGEACQGVQILITNRHAMNPLDVGLALATTLQRLYPDQWDHDPYQRLLSDQAVWEAVGRAVPPAEIRRMFTPELREFRHRRKRYLMY